MNLKICIPLKAKSLPELLQKIDEASEKADILELWLGDLSQNEIDFDEIWKHKKTPFLLNCKGPKEQGGFSGTDEKKFKILLEGAQKGAEYCDFDCEFDAKLLSKFIQEKKKAKLILSAHFFDETPHFDTLKDIAQRMKNSGADIVKIAAMANSHEDLMTMLELTDFLKEQKIPFISISMGELGKPSRVLTPMNGGEMMFAAFSEAEKTASGQMTVEEMRKIYEMIFGS
ncbi:type I 3-dehydroquinate dehydratase [Candidatus Peregrinibacteria bacterium]|nr:type I 3-dehydroquinate dehydratase [Candidatus Peregrinibacteria bacterium]